MTETKEKKFDGILFSCTQFAGRKAFTLKAKIIFKLGPALATGIAAFASRAKSASGKLDIDPFAISMALEKVGVSAEEFCALILEILSATSMKVQNAAGIEEMQLIDDNVFDNHFAGKMELAYQVAWWALEVNYGDFFSKGSIGSQIFSKQKKNPDSNPKS